MTFEAISVSNNGYI